MSIPHKQHDPEKELTPLKLALTLAGGVIGPSFSTGRETLTYFVNFGINGILGICIAFSLLGFAIYVSFCTAHNMQKFAFEWQLSPRGWRPLRQFYKWFTVVGMFAAISAMMSAAGSVLHLLAGTPIYCGALLMTTICLCSSFLNIKIFASAMSITVPILLLFTTFVCIYCIFLPVSECICASTMSSENLLMRNWLISSLIYFGYNSGASRALMPSLSKYIAKKRTCISTVLLFSILLIVLASLIMLALAMNYSISSNVDMPIVVIAYAKSHFLGLLYGIVALIAIFDACATSLQIIKSSFCELKRLSRNIKKLNLIMVAVCSGAFLISFIGFSVFVDKIWAIFGYVAFPGIGISVYNYLYYKKHPVRNCAS